MYFSPGSVLLVLFMISFTFSIGLSGVVMSLPNGKLKNGLQWIMGISIYMTIAFFAWTMSAAQAV